MLDFIPNPVNFTQDQIFACILVRLDWLPDWLPSWLPKPWHLLKPQNNHLLCAELASPLPSRCKEAFKQQQIIRLEVFLRYLWVLYNINHHPWARRKMHGLWQLRRNCQTSHGYILQRFENWNFHLVPLVYFLWWFPKVAVRADEAKTWLSV